MCLKLTIKTSKQCQWPHSGVFIVNFEHISHLILVFLLLTLNMELLTGIILPGYLASNFHFILLKLHSSQLSGVYVKIVSCLLYILKYFTSMLILKLHHWKIGDKQSLSRQYLYMATFC